MDVKKRLAREIVSDLHGAEAASKAEQSFARTFQQREFALSFRDFPGGRGTITLREISGHSQTVADFRTYSLPHVLAFSGIASSVSEARRLIAQGAVERVTPGQQEILRDVLVPLNDGDVLRVGKHRFLRIVDSDKHG
jgi:tyrosyl-tRNA synthetase